MVLTRLSLGDALRSWYADLGLAAVAMDATSLAVGTWLGVRLAGEDVVAQLLGVVAVQVAHDVLFGGALLPRLPPSTPVRLFRDYAEEKGLRILRDDAMLMVAAVAASHAVRRLPQDEAMALGATSLYASCLLLL